MRKNAVLTFGGIDISDYNCWFSGAKSFDTPQKMASLMSVPGRNGDLYIEDNRFSNIDISFDCYIQRGFIQKYNALINALHSVNGYGRLETTEEPDVYREAVFMNEIQPDTTQYNEGGTFTLTFNCKPQKWLKSGEKGIAVTDSANINNPTRWGAKPLIAVTGTGSITINDSVLTLANNTSVTYIDCDIQDAYEGTVNRNGDLTVVNGFPVLSYGSNEIAVDGCTIVLYPRWWRL